MSEPHGGGSPAPRITPYELVLLPLEPSAFPSIQAEAAQRGSDPTDRDTFALLGFVGATLRDMAADDAPAAAIDSYTELLYQGYQFWSFGRRVYVLSDATTAQLTRPEYDMAGWVLAAPPACYLQFPYQRLWGRVSADMPYEPADGCFVTVNDGGASGKPTARLRVQLALGLRADRAGLSLVSHHAEFDPRTAPVRAHAPWRAGAVAFSNAIPGGDRMGYQTIATMNELEALVLRALQFVDRNSTALRTEPGAHAVRRIIVGGDDQHER